MDLWFYFFEGFVKGMPILLAFLHMKMFKISPQKTGLVLALVLQINIYFWFIIKDSSIIIDQGLAYICAFAWIFIEILLKEKQKDIKAQEESQKEFHL